MTDTKGEDPEEDAGTGEPENHSRHDEALKSETQQCTTDAPVECATPAAKDMSPELHESRSSRLISRGLFYSLVNQVCYKAVSF